MWDCTGVTVILRKCARVARVNLVQIFLAVVLSLMIVRWITGDQKPVASDLRELRHSSQDVAHLMAPIVATSTEKLAEIPRSEGQLEREEIEDDGTGEKMEDEENEEKDEPAEAANTSTVAGRQRADPGQYYRLRATRVSPFRHRAVLSPSVLCHNSTRTIVLINSHPSNRDRRDAVRDTWGTAVRTGLWSRGPGRLVHIRGLRLAFVLGLSRAHNAAVRREHANHDDIIQGDFADNYHNMTVKSLLGMKMVLDECPAVDYLLKGDDDTLVNLPLLLAYLDSRTLRRAVIGPHLHHRRPKRKGKWALTGREFPFEFLPPYEAGSAYVLTADAVGPLFNASEYVPHIFIDDLFITGILGRIIGLGHVTGLPSTRDNTVGSPRAKFAYAKSRVPNACDFVRNRIYTGTGIEPGKMRRIWKHIASGSCPSSAPAEALIANNISS